MSPILLLTGFFALAYLGTMLVSGRTLRGSGLPSGSEFLVLGILLGPRFLGLISAEARSTFEPFNAVALSWLAVIAGAHYGQSQGGFTRKMAQGLAIAAVTAGFSALAAVAVVVSTDAIPRELLVSFALGIGAVTAETTRHAVRWVVQRFAASGPLTSAIFDMADADDVVTLGLLAAISALSASSAPIAGVPWSPLVNLVASLMLGAALGVTLAALFDIEPRTGQRWGILLGATLLGVGVSQKLGLSAVWVAFVTGIFATRSSTRRLGIAEMIEPTERPTMLPALVLAGAYVRLPATPWLWGAAAAAIGARVVAKTLSGRFLSDVPAARRSATMTGFALLPAGILTITAGLACATAIRGPVGDVILFVAVVSSLLGELLGTPALRIALRRAGELETPSQGQASRSLGVLG
jgi:Kef-type K+ transport system membrane component KefB